MPSTAPETRTRLAELVSAVRALEARVSHLEAQRGPDAAPLRGLEPSLPEGALADAGDAGAFRPAAWLPGLGRAMLILAGGFLLRAMTGAEAVQGRLGVGLGILYVLLCIRLTDRSARGADRQGAAQLGAASALVGYPLLWETSTKLELLSPAPAAACLALVTAMGLATSVRYRLWALGWLYATAALVTATGLAWVSGAPALFAGEVVLLGIATAWLAYRHGWWGPRWAAAAAANALVLLLALLAARGEGPLGGRPDPGKVATIVLALGLPLGYLATFGAHLLRGRWRAGPFEALQSIGVVAAGVLGAVLVLRAAGAPAAVAGWAMLPAAAAGQAAAFGLGRPGAARRTNTAYFAGLGLALTLLGTGLATPPGWLPYLWAALGLGAAAAAGARPGRGYLRLQSAAYLCGAAIASGLALAAAEALAAADPPPLPGLGRAGAAAWGAAGAGFCLLVGRAGRLCAAPGERLLRFLVAALVLAGAFAVATAAMAACFDGWAAAEAARLEALRTFLLTATAVAVAAASRSRRLSELGWFVGPLLILSGLKLALQDLRHGTPASLFFGFGCFGIAILTAPRLRRRGGNLAAATAPPPPAGAPTPADPV